MTSRDLARDFILTALREAGLSHSDWHKDYSDRRFDEGAVEYGPEQFMEDLCASQGLEEGIDGANWFALEFVKRWRAGTLDESCGDLMQAAIHGALMAEHGRRYREANPDT